MDFKNFLKNLPEVEHPKRKLDFKQRLIWVGIGIVLYFVLGTIPLYGLAKKPLMEFETFAVLLGAQMGTLISLGIGPIVTASIILQLLKGADILKLDLNTKEGKQMYQGLQKLFSIFFIIFENAIYVLSGALPAACPLESCPTGITPELNLFILILQLIIGGFVLLFLDELISKWGFSSGISLFIVAGVSKEIFISAISPALDPTSPLGLRVGQFFKVIGLLAQGLPLEAVFAVIPLVATIVVFVLSIYLQAVNVEVPLTFGRVRGFGIRWPLKFIYTSNIPVILVAAFIASIRLWAGMLDQMGISILGHFETSGGFRVPVSGLAMYLTPPTIRDVLVHGLPFNDALSLIVFSSFMLFGSVLFSILWVNVGQQDPKTISEQIFSSGLFIPGFRSDKRIIEKLLKRYISPLTVMGGFSVGLLAAVAEFLGALGSGTGILLSVMILYQLYEQMSRYDLTDVSPVIRKFLKGGNE